MKPIFTAVVLHNSRRAAVWFILAALWALIWFNTDPYAPAADLRRGDLVPCALAFYGSLVLALFVTIQELPMEMHCRFHLILLSKPISRTDYLVGKIIGIFCFGALVLAVTVPFAWLSQALQCEAEVPLLANLVKPLIHYTLYLWFFSVVAGITGAFMSEAFCMMITVFVFAGSIAVSLIPSILEKKVNLGAEILLRAIYYMAPNIFYFRPQHYQEYSFYTPLLVAVYALAYSGLILPVAIRRFNQISFA